MNAMQIDKLKELINNRIDELSKRSFDKNIDADGDEGDEAQGTFLLNMAYECNDRNTNEIILLCDARKKLKEGTYGICEECESDIEYKRLLACLSAKYCIKCAEMIEKENNSYKR